MNSPLTGKDSIKFGEDYNLCVLQDHPNFSLPRFETRAGADNRPQSIIYVYVLYNVKWGQTPNLKPFQKPRNRFPAWRAVQVTLFDVSARQSSYLQTFM